MTLNLVFSALYALGFLFLIVLEIIGLVRKAPGDTITENWHAIDNRLNPVLQWGWRVLSIGLIGWLAFHLAGTWK